VEKERQRRRRALPSPRKPLKRKKAPHANNHLPHDLGRRVKLGNRHLFIVYREMPQVATVTRLGWDNEATCRAPAVNRGGPDARYGPERIMAQNNAELNDADR
jgi:hypothetical protein